jgi:hypothetical protein
MVVSIRRQWRLICLFAMTLWFPVKSNTKGDATGNPQISHVDVLEHIIPWIRDCRLTIDGGGVGIWSHRRAPLDMLETPVIALGGGKDSSQGIAQGVERNDVRGRDSWHCWCCEGEEGKRGTVIGKGLTAGSSLPYQSPPT